MKSDTQSQNQVNRSVICPPVLSPEAWASMMGETVHAVRQQLDNGILPVAYLDNPVMPDGTIKKRRKKYVNVAKINQMALEQ